MIRFTVPMPPSVNAMYRNVPGRGRAKTKKYLRWAQDAGWKILADVPVGERLKISGDLKVSIVLGPRDKRSDVDNRAKAVLDLCTHMQFIRDDSDIVDLQIKWGNVEGAEVTIESNDNRPKGEEAA